jgi:hypothetical protein
MEEDNWSKELRDMRQTRIEELERISGQNRSLIKNPERFRANVRHYVVGKLAQMISQNVGWNGEGSHQNEDWYTAEDYIQSKRGGIEKNVDHYEKLLLGNVGATGAEELSEAEDESSFFGLADRVIGRFTFEDLWGTLRGDGEFLRVRGYGAITFY